jgi:hypothetical protein
VRYILHYILWEMGQKYHSPSFDLRTSSFYGRAAEFDIAPALGSLCQTGLALAQAPPHL